MSRLADQVERHWLLVLVATFGAGVGTAAALYEQILLPKVRLDSEIERKLGDVKTEEIRREIQSSFERLPQDTKNALEECTNDLDQTRLVQELLDQEVGRPSLITGGQEALVTARKQLQAASKALASCRSRDRYGLILQPASAYPLGHSSVRLGTTISEAQMRLAAYSPTLTDKWLNAEFPNGPFSRATFYHNSSGKDSTIDLIAYWFRDQDARERTIEQALCAFGAATAKKEVDGHIVAFAGVNGFDIEIDDSAYKIDGERRLFWRN